MKQNPTKRHVNTRNRILRLALVPIIKQGAVTGPGKFTPSNCPVFPCPERQIWRPNIRSPGKSGTTAENDISNNELDILTSSAAKFAANVGHVPVVRPHFSVADPSGDHREWGYSR